MMREIRRPKTRSEGDPLSDALQCGPTLDDLLMVVLATATLLGLLALIGLGSVSTASRLEAAISRLAI